MLGGAVKGHAYAGFARGGGGSTCIELGRGVHAC